MNEPTSRDSSPFEFGQLPDQSSLQKGRVVEQFGVPRRFGIGTILIVMGAASILLAFLVAWGVPAPVVFHLIAFLALIAFGQALLYRGANPRRASIVAGAIICPVYAIGAGLFFVLMTGSFREILEIFTATLCFSVMGPFLGYLAGGVVGGIFLIMDRWEQRFGKKTVAEHFDPFAPADRPVEELPESSVTKD